ncbi:MAG: DUF4445 domain-containing protein [Alphaproteobacteria bacterium]|nr:DUF4445 domain-containing protein [Alphaproteobacteria bacterium]
MKENTVPVQIKVQDCDKIIECYPGENFNEAAQRKGLAIATTCGREGTCKSCAVRIVSGKVPAATPDEKKLFDDMQLSRGWRRSCKFVPITDCTVHIPRRSLLIKSRHLIVIKKRDQLPPDPLVRSKLIKLEPSEIEGDADWERLLQALNRDKTAPPIERIDLGLLRDLSRSLRRWNWDIKVYMRGDEVIGIGPCNSRAYGIAVDLGTTNIVGFLVNLETGEVLSANSTGNPQVSFGGDIMTRLARAARDCDVRKLMQKTVVDEINNIVQELCANEVHADDIVAEMVIAGNTVMHHLLIGLDIEQLGKAPFVPATCQDLDIKARDIGLTSAPYATIHFPGIIAGFVGSDHVMALLTSLSSLRKGLSIIVDIGTNTEISIVDGDRIISVSCPSGPALEGGEISFGMSATEGAIEAVQIDGNALTLKTIQNGSPIGLCGSGVLDMVAELYRNGVINHRGRLNITNPKVRSRDDRLEFIIIEELDGIEGQISFSQDDIRAVQLAKAAIRAGIDMLLKEIGQKETALERVIVAGAFGNFLNIKNAIAVGLLPSIPLDRFEQVGNAAGKGARLALVSKEQRLQARTLAKTTSYLELSGQKAFMTAFIDRINFDYRKQNQIDGLKQSDGMETV